MRPAPDGGGQDLLPSAMRLGDGIRAGPQGQTVGPVEIVEGVDFLLLKLETESASGPVGHSVFRLILYRPARPAFLGCRYLRTKKEWTILNIKSTQK